MVATTYRYSWRALEALCTFANAQHFRTLLADRRQSVAGAPNPGRGDTSVTRFGPGCHFADRPSVRSDR